jgi:hypothetical protein
MSQRGAQKGERRGGRKKGVPNKDKTALQIEISAHLEKIGLDPDFNPVVFMAELAANPLNETDLRFQAAKEMSPYLFSKRKAIEHSGTVAVEWVDIIKEALKSDG